MTEDEIMARAVVLGQKRIEVLQQQIEEQAPKVAFADAVMAAADAILIRDLAKLITQNDHPIGQNLLFDWLRNGGYLFRHTILRIGKKGPRLGTFFDLYRTAEC